MQGGKCINTNENPSNDTLGGVGPTVDLLKSMSTREVSRKTGLSEESLRAIRREQDIPAPPPEVRSFGIPHLLAKGRKVILTSDWHVPYHNQALVDEVLETALALEAIVVVAGDIIDLPALSRFEPRDIDSSVGMELSALGDVLEPFSHYKVEVHIMRGNHELRFFKALKHQVDILDFLKMVGVGSNIYGYEDETLVLHVGGKQWLVTHPQDYSKIPLTIPRKLASKYGMSIASAHGHHYAYGISEGEQDLLEMGGLFDSSKLAYLNRGGASTFPHQQSGFWILGDYGEVMMP